MVKIGGGETIGTNLPRACPLAQENAFEF